MNQETQHGYLILADISGYTSYLAGVELTHAEDILTDLLERLVEHFKPLLSVVKLEGDAVFAHAPQAKILRGEILLELLESTYLAFRDWVESIRRQTTCECNACRAIPSLDLKYILHFGEYLPQHISGIMELVGSDVNLVHRLLKNRVSETTGWKAYALFTEAVLLQLSATMEGLYELVECYDHLGDVRTYSLDLHARYKELIAARRVFISPEESDRITMRTVLAPPVVVWGWMNDVQKRLQWEHYDDIRPLHRPGGRTGAGASNHCVHGKDLVLETILDWRPFVYFTTEYPMAVKTQYLEPLSEGTRLTVYFKLKAGLPRLLTRQMARLMFKIVNQEKQLDTLVRLIAEDVARDATA